MKYLVVSFILFFCTLQTFSQQEYFVYLQTDNNQAFYIRINNNVYSSTSSGYLILSKLPDSTVSVTTGFPKNVFPEQQFNIPVSHKDAGYLLKNFGDKGWGLFNLQTLAVIMNSNPPGEKKSPEITGSKKNDAFSVLLANAVNDTAILYTANKPPKPVAPPVLIATEEKKKDTVSLAKEELPKKDSITLVKNLPEKKDSSLVVKNTTKPKKDSLSPANTHLTPLKETATTAKNKKAAHDTASIAKNTIPQTVTGISKNATAKTNQPATGKTVSKPKKDTIIIGNNPPTSPVATAIAKNKNERRDTIIIMKGRVFEERKPIAKNAAAQKEKKPLTDSKKDSLQLVKQEVAKKPEEKITIPANNPPLVAVQNPPAKKDTVALVVKNEPAKPAEDKKDTVADLPVRRLRPLINKAAELLTDTSYVAVFVDESKDKFDTIRISIPFDEVIAHAKQDRPPAKEIKDSTPVIITEEPGAPVIKKDMATPGKIVKDTAQLITLPPAATASVKKDAANIDKAIKDSTAGATGQKPIANPVKDSVADTITRQTANPVKKDSITVNKPLKDSVSVIVQQAPPSAIKKDSAITITAAPDSGKAARPVQQPLFLNSDCKEIAWDGDIDKLRIKMLLVITDEEKIGLAKKVF
ncbi:MAG: hypothetical protein ABIR15_05270, partial [Chitinophagaceae bacterium]